MSEEQNELSTKIEKLYGTNLKFCMIQKEAVHYLLFSSLLSQTLLVSNVSLPTFHILDDGEVKWKQAGNGISRTQKLDRTGAPGGILSDFSRSILLQNIKKLERPFGEKVFEKNEKWKNSLIVPKIVKGIHSVANHQKIEGDNFRKNVSMPKKTGGTL